MKLLEQLKTKYLLLRDANEYARASDILLDRIPEDEVYEVLDWYVKKGDFTVAIDGFDANRRVRFIS